jgi:hypothetical protein
MIIYHIHHVIPKHMGGNNEESNLIKLTVEEHANAHKELWEKYGHWQDKIAWKALSGQISMDEAKLEAQRFSKLGKIVTRETRDKISKSLKGKNLSLEHRNKISDGHKGQKKPWVIEHNKSEKQRKSVSCKKPGTSLAMIGNKNHHGHIKVTCPYCGKSGAFIIMPRWHFDNCKFKP